MNELIFAFHILIVIFFLGFSLRLGKIALVIFIVLQTLCANIFILKQIKLFTLTVTSADVYIIGAMLSLNVLQEHYGKKIAKKTIYFTFYFSLFFLLMSMLHIIYLPSPSDAFHLHYNKILSLTPRIILSSIGIYFISARIDIWLYSFFKGASFSFKNILSIAISQLFDTVFFSFIALYGIVEHITHVILIIFTIKLLLIFTGSFFVSLVKKYHPQIKQDEV